jgi:hypothetical protein
MKKKSTNSQSAFLNLRVLFGLCVMLTGVFLALFATANPSGLNPLGVPDNQGVTTREEMALTVALAIGPNIQIPACVAGSEIFSDVPASSPFCPYIEELFRRGITGGCAPGLFCPGNPVSRQQMAVFIVKLSGEEPHVVGATGEPGFLNTWTNFGGTWSKAGFFKDGLGFVHLKGTISAGATGNGNPAFTLPVGYRPADDLFTAIGHSGTALGVGVLVRQNGDVTPNCGAAGCNAGLDGLSFRAPE